MTKNTGAMTSPPPYAAVETCARSGACLSDCRDPHSEPRRLWRKRRSETTSNDLHRSARHRPGLLLLL